MTSFLQRGDMPGNLPEKVEPVKGHRRGGCGGEMVSVE